MTSTRPVLTDQLLKSALSSRIVRSGARADLVSDVLAFIEALPQGRPWRLDAVGGARLVPIFALVGLMLAVALGALFVGARRLDRPVGTIAFTTAILSWDGSAVATDQRIDLIAPDGSSSHLIATIDAGVDEWNSGSGHHSGLFRVLPVLRWSPDGSRLAFRLYEASAGIYVLDREGSDPRKVADSGRKREPFTSHSSFAWSPDGTRIAYIDPETPGWPPGGAANGEIKIVDVDTGLVTQLSPTREGELDAGAGSVAWSPDGTQIAFGRNYRWASRLMAINVDGTNLRVLDDTPIPTAAGHDVRHVGPIAWSPDGSRIAFEQERFHADPEGEFLMIVNADGTDLHARDAPWQAGCCLHGAFGGILRWSPDGTRIGISTTDDGVPTILIVAADGSTESLSLEGASFDWSPDGARLVVSKYDVPFDDERSSSKGTSIWVMDADGSDATRIAQGDYPVWAGD